MMANMKASGKTLMVQIRDMGREYKFGMTEAYMKVIGRMIEPTEWED